MHIVSKQTDTHFLVAAVPLDTCKTFRAITDTVWSHLIRKASACDSDWARWFSNSQYYQRGACVFFMRS